MATANNYARPVIAGGTGANNSAAAATNLNVLSKAGGTMAGGIDMDGFSITDAVIDGTPGGKLVAGYIYGLTLSNNVADAVNDIDIAAGASASDGAVPYLMSRDASITKRLDALWAVGTNNGGLDAGTVTNTTYHVWLIQRSDTGVVDALFSLSATSPTMPTNYDRKRRIGSILRSGGTILQFMQRGDQFDLITNVVQRSSTAAFPAGPLTLTTPLGISVQPIFDSQQQQNVAGNVQTRYSTIGKTPVTYCVTSLALEIDVNCPKGGVFTNTSSQIQFEVEILSGSLILNALSLTGWIDDRGRS
ncbi:hypothetical protein D3C80_253790 [compost metagenome]